MKTEVNVWTRQTRLLGWQVGLTSTRFATFKMSPLKIVPIYLQDCSKMLSKCVSLTKNRFPKKFIKILSNLFQKGFWFS